MTAGVSTACMYPELLEESLYNLLVNGISCVEIFLNTHSETEKSFAHNCAEMLKRFDSKCISVHPYTSEMETMMLFSGYKRRVDDFLEYSRKYFEFMNIVGAEIFVFHGGKNISGQSTEFYCERYSKLYRLGQQCGVTVAIENVSRCRSGSVSFVREVVDKMGNECAFVLDTKQALRSGENPFRFIDAMGKRLVHVHISDSGELGDCLLIGRGRFDFKRFFAKLNEVNGNCGIILELYRNAFNGISDLVSGYNILTKMTEPYGRE